MAGIPDSVRHKFQKMLQDSPYAYKRFEQYLSHKDAKDENYKWALEFAHDRAYGKAQNFVEMNLNGVTKYDPETVDRAIERVGGATEAKGVAKGK